MGKTGSGGRRGIPVEETMSRTRAVAPRPDEVAREEEEEEEPERGAGEGSSVAFRGGGGGIG